MGTMRFPPRESQGHPQDDWNNMEYMIRMLTQSSIGVCVDDSFTADTVTISAHPDVSMNHISLGPVGVVTSDEIRLNSAQAGWVYVTEAGAFYFEANVRPLYNPVFHGWYRDAQGMGDRAIAFIDPELPRGWRTIIMDSPNSMFEYDQRIPDTAGDPVWEITAPSDTNWESMLLTPGHYRFELRGGNGGRGGDAGAGTLGHFARGGAGGRGQALVWNIRILVDTQFQGILSGDGEDGRTGNSLLQGPGLISRALHVTGGGGGSSGGDTRVMFKNGVAANAIGGAGGGGAVHARVGNAFSGINGPGGGGAGNPDGAEDGEVTDIGQLPRLEPGRRGDLQNGGAPGAGEVFLHPPDLEQDWIGNSGQSGHAGEGMSAGTRRDGGSSEAIFVPRTSTTINGALGGRGISGTSGYFRCFRTMDGSSW